MSLNDAKSNWQAQDDPFDGEMPDAGILDRVRERSAELDRTIRKRDRWETVAAVIVFLFFSLMLTDPSWVTRAGALLVMAGTILIAWMLRRARRTGDDVLAGASLAEALRVERGKLDSQIRLLKSVLWWYIAPLGVGIVLVVAGVRGFSWFTVGYVGIFAAFVVFVYRLNQNAVRKELLPRWEELIRQLRQIEE